MCFYLAFKYVVYMKATNTLIIPERNAKQILRP